MRATLSSAVVAIVLACSLAGCASTAGHPTAQPASASSSTSSSTSTSTSASASDLVGTTWRVSDARGDSGATLSFQGRTIGLTDPGTAHSSTFAWSAQGDQVLISRSTFALAGGSTAGWLTGTTRIARDGRGWRLFDVHGKQTGRLEPAAHSSPQGGPSPAPIDLLTIATPGPGVRDVPASAIVGRWHLAGHPITAITFADGRWSAAASCETGAAGGRGAYRVLPGGRLLVTRTASLMFGCPIRQGEIRVQAPAIAGIDRAASFRIEGTTLTLFDRSGTAIGSLGR